MDTPPARRSRTLVLTLSIVGVGCVVAGMFASVTSMPAAYVLAAIGIASIITVMAIDYPSIGHTMPTSTLSLDVASPAAATRESAEVLLIGPDQRARMIAAANQALDAVDASARPYYRALLLARMTEEAFAAHDQALLWRDALDEATTTVLNRAERAGIEPDQARSVAMRVQDALLAFQSSMLGGDERERLIDGVLREALDGPHGAEYA